MFHWIRPSAVAYAASADAVALPWGAPVAEPSARAVHSRLLAYAATRRRAAMRSALDDQRMDAVYWKASAPSALDRARRVRVRGLPALP